MQPTVTGPHHCIATATHVADTIFRYLNICCERNGGHLSIADLKDVRAKFMNSFPSGYDLFEKIYVDCMEARASPARTTLLRDAMLSSLLLACGSKSARTVFRLQISHFGDSWLQQFFDGFSQYIRKNVCIKADNRLIPLYVEAARKFKEKLSVSMLLSDDGVQCVLRDCIAPFANSSMTMAKPVCDVVNEYIAKTNEITGPELSKTTEQETQRFLTSLPRELELTLQTVKSVLGREPLNTEPSKHLPAGNLSPA